VLTKKWFHFLAPVVLITILISSCSGQSSAIFVWIDVPEDGLSFPDLRPVTIEGHATSPTEVQRIELMINGEMWTIIDDPVVDGELASFQAEWTPDSPGTYTIHAIAYGADGTTSQFDDTTITFSQELESSAISEMSDSEPDTQAEEDSAPPPEESESLIQFWADPDTIQAGDCTDIRWHVENVKKVIFGGVEQALDGTYQDCLCKNQTYTLTVVHLDQSEEKRKANVLVNGSCEVPEPEEDTTPPPAPVQSAPTNGLSIGCKSNQNLVWLPVNDESGISQYQVKVQHHSGDNNWTDIPGSVFGGISGKQHSISVECGWYYRWRVRAADGEGNIGSWSAWWTFLINLE
jgi:hypothetical protein